MGWGTGASTGMGPLAGWGHVGGGRGGPLTKEQVRFRNDVHTCICLNFQRRNDSVVPRWLNNSVTVCATVSCCNSLETLEIKGGRVIGWIPWGSWVQIEFCCWPARSSRCLKHSPPLALDLVLRHSHVLSTTSHVREPLAQGRNTGRLVEFGQEQVNLLPGCVSDPVSDTPPRASRPADVGTEQVSLALGVRL